nr:hypothetical protein [Streptomyces hygroscopicus]
MPDIIREVLVPQGGPLPGRTAQELPGEAGPWLALTVQQGGQAPPAQYRREPAGLLCRQGCGQFVEPSDEPHRAVHLVTQTCVQEGTQVRVADGRPPQRAFRERLTNELGPVVECLDEFRVPQEGGAYGVGREECGEIPWPPDDDEATRLRRLGEPVRDLAVLHDQVEYRPPRQRGVCVVRRRGGERVHERRGTSGDMEPVGVDEDGADRPAVGAGKAGQQVRVPQKGSPRLRVREDVLPPCEQPPSTPVCERAAARAGDLAR